MTQHSTEEQDQVQGRLMYEKYADLQLSRKNCEIDRWDELSENERAVWIAFAIEW